MENALRDLAGQPEEMYGRRKMTRYLRRRGHQVAFCTVDRIMREVGMNGIVRGRKLRTTIPARDGIRAGDKLNRDFTASAPNRVWIADFSCRCLSRDYYLNPVETASPRLADQMARMPHLHGPRSRVRRPPGTAGVGACAATTTAAYRPTHHARCVSNHSAFTGWIIRI
ncbi:IS3 family transposase [Nocardia sp. NRRL WC-3656]|uniref:IS3 family transposase n=1 Tax=Nocardia sp. NRRL WC-3656 TaxID=1463824 RepID=UPI0018CC1159|nr:IS3 family transposase [Nocardia sp. NRRL WC-3656]